MDILVNALGEAAPYIRKFQGKTFVVKYGGSIYGHGDDSDDSFVQDISLLMLLGIKIVIVHGGGKEITKRLDQMGMETTFVHGYRFTDKDTVKEVEMILSGGVGKELTFRMIRDNIKAISLNGKDTGLIHAEKMCIYNNDESIDIGYVGEVKEINGDILRLLISNDYVPVISPIGFDHDGNTYNLNADTVASAIAANLRAEKLILMTDVDGLYENFKEKQGFIHRLKTEDVKAYVESGVIAGGMIPKTKAAVDAVENGAKSAVLINGTKKHAMLHEIFTDKGVGTMIKK